MILMIDNYDSFTYNLYQYIGEIDPDVRVYRNDRITADEVRALSPGRVVLSPGPGYPAGAGICIELIRRLGHEIPILGVCLGHQAIVEAYGGEIVRAPRIVHGKAEQITVETDCPLFAEMGESITAGRYHSLAAREDTLPPALAVTARSEDGVIMGVSHRDFPVYGIQFHPESILTPGGAKIIENFLKK